MPRRRPRVRTAASVSRIDGADGNWCDGLPTLFGGSWRCPVSGNALSLVLGGSEGFGVLTDQSGGTGRCWPVVDGIPFLRDDRSATCDRVVDAVASGRIEEARRLLLLEPRDPGQLANQLCDSSTGKSRLREISRITERLAAADDDELAAAYDQLALAFGYELDELRPYRHLLSQPEGLAALGLLATHPPAENGLVLSLGCGLGEGLRHLAAHGLSVAGTDPDWTSLWIARHLLGTRQPMACTPPGTLAVPLTMHTRNSDTVLVGAAALGDGPDQSAALLRLVESVAPASQASRIATDPSRSFDRSSDGRPTPRGQVLLPAVPGDWPGLRDWPLLRATRDWPDERLASVAFRQSDVQAAAIGFRRPEEIGERPGGDGCFSWALTTQTKHRGAQWELMLPPEGTPLTVNPLFASWRDGATMRAAEALDWSDDDASRLDDECDSVLNWSAMDTDVVELARRRVLVAAP